MLLYMVICKNQKIHSYFKKCLMWKGLYATDACSKVILKFNGKTEIQKQTLNMTIICEINFFSLHFYLFEKFYDIIWFFCLFFLNIWPFCLSSAKNGYDFGKFLYSIHYYSCFLINSLIRLLPKLINNVLFFNDFSKHLYYILNKYYTCLKLSSAYVHVMLKNRNCVNTCNLSIRHGWCMRRWCEWYTLAGQDFQAMVPTLRQCGNQE